METILAPMDLQSLWKQPPSPPLHPSPNAKSSLVRLPSLFTMSTAASPRLVGMSDVLSAQVSPLKEKGLSRLPSIGVMMNRDESLSPVQRHCMDLYKQLQAKSPRQELNSLLADAAVSQLNERVHKADRAKRTSNAKLCGMAECNKRAKAGGFCIAHGGGLRCSEAGCTKHAPTLLAQQRQWQGCAPSFTTAPRGASPPVDDECLITFGCDSVQRFGVQLVWTPKTEGKSAWQRPLPIAVLTGFRDSQLVLPQVGSQWLQGVPATSFSCKAKH
ncbi:hypothetical protein PF005_g16107 [Phytophthora fragariae]|uniref:WRKY19-like zinc finger domain-containing protein n=1 Tax=Phytophthora fragariae TaxID=53985 RepID=A0A6A3XIS4_9STRA|nr:hypothetical protein PF005_g16107 [Phytophthora fragariae]